jgi:serine/threonine-protein kinase
MSLDHLSPLIPDFGDEDVTSSQPGGLPPELLKIARRRVAQLSGCVLICSTLGALAFFPLLRSVLEQARFPQVFFLMMVSIIGGSLALFILSRTKKIGAQLLLDLALVYEVVLAFTTALTRHSIPWDQAISRDWSEVAVWIIVFSVVIPNTPGKCLLAASLAGLTDPLGLFISVAYGNPMPSLDLFGHLFAPTFFAVILSTVLSRMIFRMGRDIQEARQLGSYQLIEEIGQGGMGEVWLARHQMLARPAAVKVIRKLEDGASHSASSEEMIRRFQKEAKATALLESEHTIRLFDFGTTNKGAFYYAMEYLNGLNLGEFLSRFGPFPVERTVYVISQVCDSLEEAHERGLVHRDIKPANIFLCKKGTKFDFAKVLDFGLVRESFKEGTAETRLTVEGRIPGTPAFLAPEIAMGNEGIDGRADLYSVGCVAYWMVSGELVFESESPIEAVLKHVSEAPVPLSERSEVEVSPLLEEIIHRCLAKDPVDRPQSANELVRLLRDLPLTSIWTQERAKKWWRTHLPEESSPSQ